MEVYKWMHVVSRPISYSLSFQVIFNLLYILIDLTAKTFVMIIISNPDYLSSEIGPKGVLWSFFFFRFPTDSEKICTRWVTIIQVPNSIANNHNSVLRASEWMAHTF